MRTINALETYDTNEDIQAILELKYSAQLIKLADLKQLAVERVKKLKDIKQKALIHYNSIIMKNEAFRCDCVIAELTELFNLTDVDIKGEK